MFFFKTNPMFEPQGARLTDCCDYTRPMRDGWRIALSIFLLGYGELGPVASRVRSSGV